MGVLLVALWVVLWLPLIAAILCMILVPGKRLSALGLSVAWLILCGVALAVGAAHCWSSCIDPPFYVLGIVVAAISVGIYLLVLISGWIVRRKSTQQR